MRFSETDFSTPAQMDFIPRSRRYQVNRMVIAFVMVLLAMFVCGLTTADTRLALANMAFVSGLCFYVVFQAQRNVDVVMATEYQNMLFAQAATLGASFALFVKRDGTVVYANEGMRVLFPRFAHGDAKALQGVFEEGDVSPADRERVQAALSANERARIIFPLRMPSGENKDFILTVEPLQRPGGFFVIRGREYRDQRDGVQLLPHMLRVTSADKIDHMLAGTPVGLYITDGFGRLEYVNPALEKALGYAPGEMLTARLWLPQMLVQLSSHAVAEDYSMTDYDGEATLRCQDGQTLNVLLNQRLLRDANGKGSGVSGSVLPRDNA